ncbi:hypothetical protein WJX84_002776, partial [Apatococcus fuscideae]
PGTPKSPASHGFGFSRAPSTDTEQVLSPSKTPKKTPGGSKRARELAVLDHALGLYHLTQYRILFEPTSDTKAIVAWNKSTILISFRGTASLRAVRLDLEAFRVDHPPTRGKAWKHTRPRVHAGFLECWQRNSFHKRLIGLIWEEILEQRLPTKADEPFVRITGHSLGGALATLAAIDIRRHLQLTNIHVVTFGAPRTGNRAFALEYQCLVPDTWHVINARDPVSHWAKFGGLYKRCGQRALISKEGDLIVRPSFLELRMHFMTDWRRTQVSDHYLLSYQSAIVAVLRTQLGDRGLEQGVEGCLALAQSIDLKKLLPLADMKLTAAENARLKEVMDASGSHHTRRFLSFSNMLRPTQSFKGLPRWGSGLHRPSLSKGSLTLLGRRSKSVHGAAHNPPSSVPEPPNLELTPHMTDAMSHQGHVEPSHASLSRLRHSSFVGDPPSFTAPHSAPSLQSNQMPSYGLSWSLAAANPKAL